MKDLLKMNDEIVEDEKIGSGSGICSGICSGGRRKSIEGWKELKKKN